MLNIFKNINAFVFDVDGVLTDGALLVLDNGLMARKMHVKDGYALQLAIKKGYSIFIISGGKSPQVRDRLLKLGVENIFMGEENKLEKLQELEKKFNLTKEEILYMGDDIPDMGVMQYCGLACCPADAVAEVKTISKYISSFKGGEGCVRDVIEKVMKLQGKWMQDMHITSA
ncbi:KdsC family phosphatase [Parafilimonas sp.]|uniref:KdsC family phosphatase n=1 Tax=Parafilimonas sp. TaxID=1969739 RepID=UPI0039E22C63